jgi:ketosteroid isomerase-like protein
MLSSVDAPILPFRKQRTRRNKKRGQEMHFNEELLRKGYEAYEKGDIETVISVLADDIKWHSPGRNPISGDYKGKDEVLAYFGKKMEFTDGTFRQRVEDVLANDNQAIGLVTFLAERGLKTLQMRTVHVVGVQDGKIAEFWEYRDDPYAWDKFWSSNGDKPSG